MSINYLCLQLLSYIAVLTAFIIYLCLKLFIIFLDANLPNTAPEASSTPPQQPLTTENQRSNNSPTSVEFDFNKIHFDFNINQSLLKDLQDKCPKFYNEQINKPPEEKKCDIKNLQKNTEDKWHLANHMIETFISCNKFTTDLYVSIIKYRTILTVLHKNDCLKEKNTKAKKQTKMVTLS